MNKLKALIFYQYLPPWRIDVFNEMGKYYDLTIVFTNANCDGFTYNREDLLNKLHNIKTLFLNNGFKICNRPIRFGIFNLIKVLHPDIIFSHEYSPTSILIALYKQLGIFHYKYYLTTSDNLQMAEAASGLKAKSREYVLNHSNGIVVYSKAVKQWYQQKFPMLKIEICPNIQNPQTLLAYRPQFQPIIQKYISKYKLTDTNIILYIGRLVKVKGLDLLLTAFAEASLENYKLVIVGEGDQHIPLLQQTKLLNISEKVIFAGFHSGIELYAWYNIANYFILPSRYEPFGAVVNEALVYGCPVIASKYIGAIDFITQNNGILFDPLNKIEFIKVIKQASIKYSSTMSERNNLMPCSFNDYVYSFYKINQSYED
jgi:glycosyltransferase